MSEQGPFASSIETTPSTWQGNGPPLPSDDAVGAIFAPQPQIHPDITTRRSHSTPDLATLIAEDNSAMESAPSFNFNAGSPRSEQGQSIAPRRSVSMPDGQNLRLWSYAELIALADRMQQGLNIRDRVHHFKKYSCCFPGADAVRWLVRSGNAGSDGEALLLGNDMLRAGLLHHVKHKRPFEKNGNLYRFSDFPSGASDITEDSRTDVSLPSPPPETSDFASFERLYDGVWARRGVAKLGQGLPLGGVQREGWSNAAELSRLQRKVAELAAELEVHGSLTEELEGRVWVQEHKELNNVMLDSLTLQLKNQQHLFALQQHRLERAIRRGTWIAVQLQVVWVLLVALLSWLTQRQQSQQPPSSFGTPFAQILVHVLAVASTLAVLGWRPWLLAPPRKLPESDAAPAPAPQEAGAQLPEGAGEKAQEGAEVAVLADAASGAVQGQRVQLSALSQDDLERLERPPSEEDFANWPDAPLLLRAAPLPYQQLERGADPCAIRINDGRRAAQRIAFKTEAFGGCAVIWAQGLPSSPDWLFAGARRKTSITIQGRFKRDSTVENVVTGQEFGRRPKNLPAMWLVEKVLIKLAKRISPSMDIGPLSAPYLLAPVLAMAQLVNVSWPGEEPDVCQPIPEDMRLFDATLTDSRGGPMDALKRKKHFWDKRNRAGCSFTREHVWTFQLYQHFVDLGAYELNMISAFDLGRHLDGQPLQFMLKDRGSGEYLFNFHSWHTKLLPAAHAAHDSAGGTTGTGQE